LTVTFHNGDPHESPYLGSAEGTDAVMPTQSAPRGVSVVAVVSLVAGVDPQGTLDAVGGQSLPPTEVRLIGRRSPRRPPEWC
jgi:hypothetical protein